MKLYEYLTRPPKAPPAVGSQEKLEAQQQKEKSDTLTQKAPVTDMTSTRTAANDLIKEETKAVVTENSSAVNAANNATVDGEGTYVRKVADVKESAGRGA